MNINVNGINVSVKQYADGAWGASYTTEFAPDSDIHTQIATAIGAVTWQHQCIGASAPWSMNADGDATWVMDFTPDAQMLPSARLLLSVAGANDGMSDMEVLSTIRDMGHVWTNEAGWVHTSQREVLISLAHGN